MNLVLVKTILWSGTAALFGLLGWTLYEYKAKEASLLGRQVTSELQQSLLKDIQSPPPPKSDLVDYRRVTANFHDFNWIGKPPPPPEVKPKEDTGPIRRQVKPIKDLVSVLYIQVDSSRPENSLALVRWVDSKLAQTMGAKQDGRLMAGTVLAAPYDYWSVESIDSAGLLFRYAPEDEQDQSPTSVRLAPPSPIEGGIVQVGEDGVVLMPSALSLPEADGTFSVLRPNRTLQVGPNRFRMGIEDSQYINDNYLDILSSEVQHKRHYDRSSGHFEGIEITQVAPGSLAAQHGVKAGDVIKSINGTPVNSVQEAISYAKNNSELYSVWTIVVSNAGYDRTIIYETE